MRRSIDPAYATYYNAHVTYIDDMEKDMEVRFAKEITEYDVLFAEQILWAQGIRFDGFRIVLAGPGITHGAEARMWNMNRNGIEMRLRPLKRE